MNQEKTNLDNRVLGRIGAREWTARVFDGVTGLIQTETVCSFNWITGTTDGDVGEC